MHANSIINILTSLGHYCNELAQNSPKYHICLNDLIVGDSWFIDSNVRYALNAWASSLKENDINAWLNNYQIEKIQSKTIGLIMAGNVPLVGMHDLICALACGHRAIVKPALQDHLLMNHFVSYLTNKFPVLSSRIKVVEKIASAEVDAVIATGSDNTARYFDYYFQNTPSLIRKNRNSLAIILNDVTDNNLSNLADDVFLHFGLGCRNISLIFMPLSFDQNRLFNALNKYSHIIEYKKYRNSYTYHKARLNLIEEPFEDHLFYITIAQKSLDAHPATINLFVYHDMHEVIEFINANSYKIQCVASNSVIEGIKTISFGQCQSPALTDYADEIDTMQFLCSL